MSANEVTTPKKTCQTELRELKSLWNYHSNKCESSYFQSRRENSQGKIFQAYCSIDVGEEKDSPVLFTQYLRSFRHIAKLGVRMLRSR